jgi:hypothetical protein
MPQIFVAQRGAQYRSSFWVGWIVKTDIFLSLAFSYQKLLKGRSFLHFCSLFSLFIFFTFFPLYILPLYGMSKKIPRCIVFDTSIYNTRCRFLSFVFLCACGIQLIRVCVCVCVVESSLRCKLGNSGYFLYVFFFTHAYNIATILINNAIYRTTIILFHLLILIM